MLDMYVVTCGVQLVVICYGRDVLHWHQALLADCCHWLRLRRENALSQHL